MPHLDEGHIHAMLDGELSAADREVAEQHLRACTECQQLLAEARNLFAEADRLVETLVPPAASQPVRKLSPVHSQRKRYQWLAWAATVVIAVGLGYYGSALDRPRPAGVNDSALKQEAMREPAPGNVAATPPADAASGYEQKSETHPAPEVSKSAPGPKAPAPPSTMNKAAPVEPSVSGQRADALDEAAEEGQLLRDKEQNEKDAKAARVEPPGRLAEVPMPKPRVLNTEIPTGFRASSLEEAVRVLGGSVLLIDGMTPQMVLVGPGGAFAGGNPNQEVVRVVYDDPPGRQLWLDQQRIEQRSEGAAQALRATSNLNLLPGDTLVTPAADGASSLNWVSQTMFRLGLRGFLPTDSLRALARRVR
ncbi:MAG TPA: zf-HC2 domain-containing protein [Gemmatimonadales bacterium]|nr:zf-HC2 domain-containing protein [Gemmatimonadales bacterium]